MAIIRRGYSDDFVLKNGNAGIGSADPQTSLDVAGVVKGQDLKAVGVSSLSGYEGFLNSDQQIDESISINSGASLSGEIIVGTGQTVTVTGVGLGTTTVGVGTFGTEYSGGTITNTIDTTEVNSASQGAIESLKVYNTFNPPLGGTNDRPYAAKPGQLYYNQDFKTIEFWDGNNWRQVDNTTRSGRAVFGGGDIPGGVRVSTINFVNIQTKGNSKHFGDLTVARSDHNRGVVSSSSRGIFIGGGPGSLPNLNVIDYITIASEGNAIDFGDSTGTPATSSACSSSTRGISAGGATPSLTNVIEYIEISTIGNALDFGDLSNARPNGSGFASPTRGVFGGGTDPSPSNRIDFITIASKGNAIIFGDLTRARRGTGSCASSTRGLFIGGSIPGYIKTIDYVTTASTGNALTFGDLTGARGFGGTAGSQTRALIAAGYNGSAYLNSIEYVTISSSGDAQDFGDLSYDPNVPAGCSDSHGGLGGF